VGYNKKVVTSGNLGNVWYRCVVSLITYISKNGPKILFNHKVSCFMHFQKRIHQDVKICPKITLKIVMIFHMQAFECLLVFFIAKIIPCFIVYYYLDMFIVFYVKAFIIYFLSSWKHFLFYYLLLAKGVHGFLCKHLLFLFFFSFSFYFIWSNCSFLYVNIQLFAFILCLLLVEGICSFL